MVASIERFITALRGGGDPVRCDIALGAGVNTAFDDASAGNLAALAALGSQLVAAEINNALTVLAPPPVA
jgi:hypothetical protein